MALAWRQRSGVLVIPVLSLHTGDLYGRQKDMEFSWQFEYNTAIRWPIICMTVCRRDLMTSAIFE